MTALLQHHLPLLAIPLLGGVAIGCFSTGGTPSRLGWGLVTVAGLALAAALAAAALKVVPGALGLQLETALTFALAYLAGCGLGLLVRVVYEPQEPAPARPD